MNCTAAKSYDQSGTLYGDYMADKQGEHLNRIAF